MKRNMVYVIGLILMFSSAGAYLNAQPMGDGDIGTDREGIAGGLEGGDWGMPPGEGFGGLKIPRGGNAKFPHKKMRHKNKKFQGRDINRDVEVETVKIIKKYAPAFAETLNKLKTSAPRKYKLILRTSSRYLFKRSAGGSQKDAVESIKLEYETRELSFKYKKASSGEKKSIKNSLKTKISRLFDLKAKGQEARIKNMEKNLKELRVKLKNRKIHKAEIVKSRVNRLVGEGYTW